MSNLAFAGDGAWYAYYDATSGRDYFSNTSNGVTQWDCPNELLIQVTALRTAYPTGPVPAMGDPNNSSVVDEAMRIVAAHNLSQPPSQDEAGTSDPAPVPSSASAPPAGTSLTPSLPTGPSVKSPPPIPVTTSSSPTASSPLTPPATNRPRTVPPPLPIAAGNNSAPAPAPAAPAPAPAPAPASASAQSDTIPPESSDSSSRSSSSFSAQLPRSDLYINLDMDLAPASVPITVSNKNDNTILSSSASSSLLPSSASSSSVSASAVADYAHAPNAVTATAATTATTTTGAEAEEDDAAISDAQAEAAKHFLQSPVAATSSQPHVYGTLGRWQLYFSPQYQRTYFYDASTRETTWTCPPEVADAFFGQRLEEKHMASLTAASTVVSDSDATALSTATSAASFTDGASSADAATAAAIQSANSSMRSSQNRFAEELKAEAVTLNTTAASTTATATAASSSKSPAPHHHHQPLCESKLAKTVAPVVIEGLVMKRTNGIRKVWKQRYVVIEDGRIKYWNDAEEAKKDRAKPRGEAEVLGCSLLLPSPAAGLDDLANSMYVNAAEFKERVLYWMQFANQAEMDQWCTVLVRNGAVDARHPLFESSLAAKVQTNRKATHAVLYPDRIDAYVAKGDPKPVFSIPLTRKTVSYQDGVDTLRIDTAESFVRGVKAGNSATLTFENTSTYQRWADAVSDVVLGPQGGIFGAHLRWTIVRSPYCIPALLYDCVKFLSERGLKEEGIFRIPGNQDTIRQLRVAYDACSDRAKTLMRDPHSVGGVLKLFFRELADAVVPMSEYARFTSLNCKSAANKEAKVDAVSGMIQALPEENQLCLNQLAYLLKCVSAHSEVNKMAPKNCAMVFAPGLFRNPAAVGTGPGPGGAGGGGAGGGAAGSSSSSSSGMGAGAMSPVSPTSPGGLRTSYTFGNTSMTNPTLLAEEILEQEAVIHLIIENYSTIFPQGPPFTI